jgi:hypothetical protein
MNSYSWFRHPLVLQDQVQPIGVGQRQRQRHSDRSPENNFHLGHHVPALPPNVREALVGLQLGASPCQ